MIFQVNECNRNQYLFDVQKLKEATVIQGDICKTDSQNVSSQIKKTPTTKHQIIHASVGFAQTGIADMSKANPHIDPGFLRTF